VTSARRIPIARDALGTAVVKGANRLDVARGPVPDSIFAPIDDPPPGELSAIDGGSLH